MPKPRSKRPVQPAPLSPARRRVGLVVMFTLGFVLAFLFGSWTTGPDAAERTTTELQQAEAKREVEQIAALNELAVGTRDRLTPVLTAMAKTGVTGQEIHEWRKVVAAEVERYKVTPSMGNGVNVARTGFRSAVEQLAAAVGGFEAAHAAAEPLKATLASLAIEQRGVALLTWTVAALQLDVINVDAGNGHRHVQFQQGAAPDGSGRRTP